MLSPLTLMITASAAGAVGSAAAGAAASGFFWAQSVPAVVQAASRSAEVESVLKVFILIKSFRVLVGSIFE